MRRKSTIRVAGWVLSCALSILPIAAHAATQRFVVVSNDEEIGTVSVSRDDERIEVEFRIDHNGRGPKLHETLRLGQSGLPIEWHIEGESGMGAPVLESFEVRSGKASWKTLGDFGSATAGITPLYLAKNTSPWSYGLYLSALLGTPNLAMDVLPAGRLRAEKLRDTRVKSGQHVQTAGVYALWGLDLAPQLVLMTESGRFFGVIGPAFAVLPEGYRGAFPTLAQLATELHREYLERLTGKFVHRFDRPIYIRNVRVFDSHRAALGPLSTVIVYRDRITGVRFVAEPPADAIVVDGEGGTLLPGLTDMHAHVSVWDMPLYLAGGVTSVRDLGNDNERLLDLVARTEAGTLMGPRTTMYGFLEGRSPFSASMGFVVDRLPAALEKVRWYADRGYRGIKIYSSIQPEWVAPIAQQAHRLGLRVSGHVPAFVTSEHAVRSGFDEINHMNQLLLSFVLSEEEDTRTTLRFTAVGERIGKLDLQSEPVQKMIAMMRERGTTVDVTMAGLQWMLLSQPGKSPPAIEGWLSHMPSRVQRERRSAVLDIGNGQLALYHASWNKLLDALKLLYDAGVRILPGTDDVPGFMLHSELEVYGKSGIPNAGVLQMATLGCARYLGNDQDLGSIEAGKLADLLLVDGDPTEDLRVLRQVRMVVKDGDVIFPEEVYSAMGIQPFGQKPPIHIPKSNSTATGRGALTTRGFALN